MMRGLRRLTSFIQTIRSSISLCLPSLLYECQLMVLIIVCISIMRITTPDDMTLILVNGFELVNRL